MPLSFCIDLVHGHDHPSFVGVLIQDKLVKQFIYRCAFVVKIQAFNERPELGFSLFCQLQQC
jgi:hypothetical protein